MDVLGIINPTKATRLALQNAACVAGARIRRIHSPDCGS